MEPAHDDSADASRLGNPLTIAVSFVSRCSKGDLALSRSLETNETAVCSLEGLLKVALRALILKNRDCGYFCLFHPSSGADSSPVWRSTCSGRMKEYGFSRR